MLCIVMQLQASSSCVVIGTRSATYLPCVVTNKHHRNEYGEGSEGRLLWPMTLYDLITHRVLYRTPIKSLAGSMHTRI